MEYKGIHYEVVQTANPYGWKWVVHLNEIRIRTGDSPSREAAMSNAEGIIDKALKASKAK
jgi:hypothetical protein